jgi:hypothetical protein
MLNFFQQSSSILTENVYNTPWQYPLTASSLAHLTNNMPATNELLQEGRYRIDQPASGTDNVFEAYDTVRKTAVIVREIPVKMNKVMTVSQQESLKIAFSNQAKALKEIQHESITPVHDFFSEIDRQYLVMEAIEGDSLAAMLDRNRRPFTVEDITRWADQLLDALNYIHNQRPAIIHRNIRPQNLKVNNGKVRLFGVCPDGAAEAGSNEELRYSPMEQIWPGLDPASQKVITNSYDDRSERILKEPLDARSDIYSLGATLYFLATGCEPVDPLERSIDILEGKLDPLREPTSVNPDIAPEISDVLMKALEIKRENRYDSAAIMRQVLQSAVSRLREREGFAKSQEPAEAPVPAVQAKPEPPKPVVETPRAPVVEAARVEPPPPTFVQKVEAKVEEPAPAATVTPQFSAPADVVAYRDTEAVDEDELAAVLKELEEAESKVEKETPAPVEKVVTVEPVMKFEKAEAVEPVTKFEKAEAVEPVTNFEKAETVEPVTMYEEIREPVIDHGTIESVPEVPVQTFDAVIDSAPARASYEAEDDDSIFSAEKPGFSLPLPVLAGGVVLVVVLAIGGWFVMSGSSEKPKPAAQTETVAPPATTEQAPAEQTAETQPTATETTTAAVESTQGQDQPGAVKASASPKAKKTEPAKTDKKKVTADDLINDN